MQNLQNNQIDLESIFNFSRSLTFFEINSIFQTFFNKDDFYISLALLDFSSELFKTILIQGHLEKKLILLYFDDNFHLIQQILDYVSDISVTPKANYSTANISQLKSNLTPSEINTIRIISNAFETIKILNQIRNL